MRLEKAGERIYYQPAALVFYEYQDHRFTLDYWRQRIERHAQAIAIIDVQARKGKLIQGSVG